MVEDPGDAAGLATGLARPARRGHGEQGRAAGGKAATYRELTPKEAETQGSTIIDGGTLSNFPVWLFDVDTPNRSR